MAEVTDWRITPTGDLYSLVVETKLSGAGTASAPKSMNEVLINPATRAAGRCRVDFRL